MPNPQASHITNNSETIFRYVLYQFCHFEQEAYLVWCIETTPKQTRLAFSIYKS